MFRIGIFMFLELSITVGGDKIHLYSKNLVVSLSIQGY